MVLRAEKIADLLCSGGNGNERTPGTLVISPQPDLDQLRKSGSASVDLRLGTWFASLRRARSSHLDIMEQPPESRLTKHVHVPFGTKYVLHPQAFVLGVTLEWLHIPPTLAGYVIGKSGWGRRGIIIATATGVHPGFTGCLTLEIANAGEIPVAITPGMRICQLFLHEVSVTQSSYVDRSSFNACRKPVLGKLAPDELATSLFKAYETEQSDS